jgi:hypothetical protein
MKSRSTQMRSDFETTDATPRTALWLALALAGLVLTALLLAGLVASSRRRPEAAASLASFTHGPEDKPATVRAWAEQDRLVRLHLDTYGWIDRKQAVVRIPITRAMALLAAESAATAGDAPTEDRP